MRQTREYGHQCGDQVGLPRAGHSGDDGGDDLGQNRRNLAGQPAQHLPQQRRRERARAVLEGRGEKPRGGVEVGPENFAAAAGPVDPPGERLDASRTKKRAQALRRGLQHARVVGRDGERDDVAKARGVRGPGLGLRRGFQEPAQQIEGGLYQHRSLPVRRGENAAQRGNGELVQRREARGHGGERLEHVPGVRGEQRVRHLRRPHPQRRRSQRSRPSRRRYERPPP